MTDSQTYTIKEMLEKIEERSTAERTITNHKIDSVHQDLKEFITDSREENEVQDKRIGSLENWKNFIMGAFWVMSGIAAVLFVVFEFLVKE
jgi:hypothetical protein